MGADGVADDRWPELEDRSTAHDATFTKKWNITSDDIAGMNASGMY